MLPNIKNEKFEQKENIFDCFAVLIQENNEKKILLENNNL